MAERSGRSGAIVALAVVVLLLAAGFVFRERILGMWNDRADPVAASPEVADAAQAKLDGIARGGDSVSLSGVEITSLLRYRAPAAALEMIREPAVEITGDTLLLTGMVPTDRLPPDPNLEKIRLLLPDTAKLAVKGTLTPRGPGEAALELRGVEFAGVPIPARYFPAILAKLGRHDEPGLDPSAVGIHLPARVAVARLAGGYLVLTPAAR